MVGRCVHPSDGEFVGLAELDRLDGSGGREFYCGMGGVLICVTVMCIWKREEGGEENGIIHLH